jgi:hypothetical protein
MKFRAEATGDKNHRRILRDEQQVGQAIRLSNGEWAAFKNATAVRDWFETHNFFVAFDSHRTDCKPMFDWLDENATHLAKGWDLYHSGGGCTHYYATGELNGKKCQFMICYESYAEPNPVQDEPLWALVAQELDDEGEMTAEAIILEGHKDMRELVIASRETDMTKLEWNPI